MNDADREKFILKLKRWKSEGCSVLVVGEALDLLRETSELLLGAEDCRRYRIFVLSDTTPATARDRLQDASDSTLERRAKVIDYDSVPRSEADVTTCSPGQIPVVPVFGGLDRLYEEVTETIAEFEFQADSLRAGSLRVSIDTVDDLLLHFDRNEVVRWLYHIRNVTKSYSGIAHSILAKPYSAESVQELATDFDAVIEVQPYDDGRPSRKERWHVPGEDLTTPWRVPDDTSRGTL